MSKPKSKVKVKDPYQQTNSFIDNTLGEIAYRSCNFNDTPPIIGLIISNFDGYTLMVIEYNSEEGSSYGPIKSYLSKDDENLLELISMYFSSIKNIAGQINIQNLSHFEVYGSNIKVQIYFLFEKYMIIALLNSHTNLNSNEKTQVISYMKEHLATHDYEFQNFNATCSRELFRSLELKSKKWLKKINNSLIQSYKSDYLRKHGVIENVMKEIQPIIQTELFEHLENAPDEMLCDLAKELSNKIQDLLFRSFP
ncbi:MAG: hypothetical protein ACTSV5_06620 [Promethearchaeota archaeon]